ncbi:aspartate/glutamate racemase family protein [Sphingorhabdus arenilitoris]|uniref:Aspartate/glutamate racemase family protein n=1 Tax=Sphingorhabdus arenilitoris TaxID=1490041 RepID=A0ABV8RIE0_9SPHN
MRKIGLIGAVNWYAMSLYFHRINTQIHKRIGGTCSPPIILESLNCGDISSDLSDADWDQIGKALVASAKRMEDAGATALLICANSMHRVYDEVVAAVDVPVIHIVDAVGKKIKADGIGSAALMGTRNVMAENWYRQRLVKQGVTLAPAKPERVTEIDRIIHKELNLGIVTRDSERTLKTFITNYDQEGVKAIILGAAELVKLVDTKANVLPIYNSTEIHADSIVDWILGDAP